MPMDNGVTSPVADTPKNWPFEVDHSTDAVMSCVLPSLKVPIAVSCAGTPRARESPPGPTAMLTNEAALT